MAISVAELNAWKQYRLQPQYFTDFLTVGATAATDEANACLAQVDLATKAQGSNLSRTNCPAGKLSGQQTFRMHALRAESFFYTANGVAAGLTNLQGVAELFVAHQAATVVSVKFTEQQIIAIPMSMAPAGIGPWGFVSDSIRPIVTNGHPDAGSKYVFPKESAPVLEPQASLNISLSRNLIGAVNVPNEVNGFTGLKYLRVYADGVLLQSATGAY